VSTAAYKKKPSYAARETKAPDETSLRQLSKTLTVQQHLEQHETLAMGPLATMKDDDGSEPPVLHGCAPTTIGHPMVLENSFADKDDGVAKDFGEDVGLRNVCN
jgi:hypothetical protein